MLDRGQGRLGPRVRGERQTAATVASHQGHLSAGHSGPHSLPSASQWHGQESAPWTEGPCLPAPGDGQGPDLQSLRCQAPRPEHHVGPAESQRDWHCPHWLAQGRKLRERKSKNYPPQRQRSWGLDPGAPWLPTPQGPGTGVEGGAQSSQSSEGSGLQGPAGRTPPALHSRPRPGSGLAGALGTQGAGPAPSPPPGSLHSPCCPASADTQRPRPQGSRRCPAPGAGAARDAAHLRRQGLRLQVPPMGPERKQQAPGP